MSGNQALNTNYGIGGVPDLAITDHGSDWYFTVCAIMVVSTLAFMGMAMSLPRSHRIFHYITASITMVASIAYFSMGAGLGQTAIQVEFPRTGGQIGDMGYGTREIFYVRYIDWFVTTPLLLLDLLLTAGVPMPTIMVVILADEIMIVTGLVGALTSSSYKWGYWLFGMLALFYVFYSLVFVGRSHARALGPHPSSTFIKCGVLTMGLWFLYPIAWGLSEGGNVIHPDSEAIFYGILDILAKPVFGILLLTGHKNIDPAELGLHIRDPVENGTSTHHNNTATGEKRGIFGRKNKNATTAPTTTANTTV